MKKLIFKILSLLVFSPVFSQALETTPPEYIRTVQFQGNSQFSGTPIVALGESISLTFDDLIGDETDYYYTIEHYDFNWQPSNLAKNEYMEGFDNMRILNYQNSFNTLQIYSHYNLTIPNRNTRSLKVSGNYMLKIFNADKELVFSRKFMVYEDIALVKAEIKRSRNLKFIDEKQVVYFSVDGSDRIVFRNPDQNLKTLIIQNNNLQSSIYNLKPQYSLGNELIYRYDQEAAFWGGNEYLEFDNKDVRAATMNVRSIELKEIYNTYLYTDKNRSYDPYTYDPDINGQFRVNTIQGEDPTIESEYTWVHFSLANYEKLNGGEIHLYGNFNNFNLDESTKLTYNSKRDVFEAKRLFKQGFYNYKYVLLMPDGTINEGFNSGNFDETENQYTILAYYRDIGGRYDRIVGVGSANSRNISN
ncbi:DUF5103 domain-containing protein [Mesonia sp.]|uniref:type IX secretion system plug protein n=1 Tax=Mesonia sp. TaxID=1960830 RepID=UPI00176335F3|nr:DUF5103 domain-containing protein [Mesonia sp.]HIB38232.1 DUF5103 domain-containing protein [Mesonia sp.]HIO26545.1 DUF5103 domain-containing protein [Flavobacteriaceae bacterium]